MKKTRIFALAITILMFAVVAFGCSPKLDEQAALVATKYYSDIIMKQDVVSANEYCAYDRVALTEALYTKWAADEGLTLDAYIKDLASKRELEDEINSVSDILTLQSQRYAKKQADKNGADYMGQTPEVVGFSASESTTVKNVYDTLTSRYAKDGVDFTQYFDYSTVEDSVIVSVGLNGENKDVSDVVLVKVAGEWLYLS